MQNKSIQLFIISMLWLFSFSTTYCQVNALDQKISITFHDLSIKQALNQLSEETGYTINYASSKADPSRIVTTHYDQRRLADIIIEIWGSNNIKLEASGNTVDILSRQVVKKQKGDLTGTITDNKGKPLPGATVQLLNTSFGTITDGQGKFVIGNVPNGTYTAVISIVGFEKYKRSIEVKGASINMRVSLTESVNKLEEIVVMGKTEARELSEEPITITALDARPVREQSLGAEQLLKVSTGVVVRQNGGLGSPVTINLNGLSGNAVRVFYDGIPLEVFNGGLQINTIPVDALDRIDVYKGVMPIDISTDALGGGINIVPAKKEYDNLNASYTFGSFNTHRVTLNATKNLSEKVTVSTLSFFNYSDNDYTMRNIESFTNDLTVEVIDVERFHDRHVSGYAELSLKLKNLKWADQLEYAPFYAFRDDDIQHGAFIFTTASGEITANFHTFAQRLDYRKKLLKDKLDLRYYGLLSFSRNQVQDSTLSRYNWRGERLTIPNNDGVELFGVPILREGRDLGTAHRAILKHKISGEIDITVSNFYQYTRIKGEDPANPGIDLEDGTVDPNTVPSTLRRNIFGAELTAGLLDKKLTPLVFYKNYDFNSESIDILVRGVTRLPVREVQANDHGYGVALKYQINPGIFIRSSFERTVRLPTDNEIFGDFGGILPNYELRPEKSSNINLGVQYNKFFKNGRELLVKVDGFIRDQEDLIRPERFGFENIRFVNEAQVDGIGIELSTRFNPLKNLSLSTNFTSQSNEIGSGGNSTGSEGRQVPNIPRLFFNTSARYTFENLFNSSNALEVFWTYFFIDRFSRNEVADINRANPENIIPAQHVNNTGFIYRIQEEGLSFSFNLNNVFNAEVFDNFRIPRPGINYQIKINYSL